MATESSERTAEESLKASRELAGLLSEAIHRGASDLHISPGSPPTLRVSGEVLALGMSLLEPKQSREFVCGLMNERQQEDFEVQGSLNFSVSLAGLGRFRINAFRAQGKVCGAFRVIRRSLSPLSDLGLPPVIGELALRQHGMVIVTGPTGSGKTTTLAAMLHHINQNERCRIITIEDPIEYLHAPIRSTVIQREIGSDVSLFEIAILEALREDPDVLCVGEMRSKQSISAALAAAETGHLVLTTLHTSDAPTSINRILDCFSPEEQRFVRSQLANFLVAIISQELLPRSDRKGLVPSIEILIGTPAVANIIREGAVQNLYDVIMTGSNLGMIDHDRSIRELYQKGHISEETARENMRQPGRLDGGAF